jgi:hypothetical protein
MAEEDLAVSGANRIDESSRVEAWRLKVALDLGYQVDAAEEIATSDADLHQLEGLIRNGCSLELAARIV